MQSVRKKIVFSHDPTDLTNLIDKNGNSTFFGREVMHLETNGFKLQQNGNVWEAVRG